METKMCVSCNEYKPIRSFSKWVKKDGSIGYAGKCYQCYMKAKNQVEFKKYCKDYYENNIKNNEEKVYAKIKRTNAWRRKNKDRIKEYGDRYRRENKDKIKLLTDKWRRENKRLVKSYALKAKDSHARICSARGLDRHNTPEEITDSYVITRKINRLIKLKTVKWKT